MLMRLTAILLFLMAVQSSFPGETGETMRDRYGPPISETFLVRPGVVVSAKYGKTGHFCELFVAPQKPTGLIKSADQTAKTIDSKLLAEVIDELVPERERGRGKMAIFYNIACLPANDCWGAGGSWEKVEIYRNGGTNDEHYATIQWHGAECEPTPVTE